MKQRSKFAIFAFTMIGLTSMIISGCSKDETPVAPKKNLLITWANPTDISAGTPLSATQLNATVGAMGTFVYNPALGTILKTGQNQTLSVLFTPTDTEVYNNVSSTVKINVVIKVGDSYQGGRVAYIFGATDPGYVAGETHGLITPDSDQSSGIVWFNGSYLTTGTTATALGTGNDNTMTIISKLGAGNYAAKLCGDLVYGGCSDWYLPSKFELNQLYQNKTAIGGFANADYWSSSEMSNTGASSIDFTGGNIFTGDKINAQHVRAVRSF